MIEGVITRISNQEGASLSVIATGGLAHLFAPHIPQIVMVDDQLTMRGLVHIHALNKG